MPGSEVCVPGSLTIDPSQQFAYIAEVINGINAGSSDIHAYRINATTGALTEAPGSPVNIQDMASLVTVDPWGRFAFAYGGRSGGIWAFTIDSSSGVLAVVPGSPFRIASPPTYTMTIDPRGQFAYLNNGQRHLHLFHQCLDRDAHRKRRTRTRSNGVRAAGDRPQRAIRLCAHCIRPVRLFDRRLNRRAHADQR